MVKIIDIDLDNQLRKFVISEKGIIEIAGRKSADGVPPNNYDDDLQVDKEEYFEGAKQIFEEVTYRRRNPELKKKAIIANKGYSCYICGFNFQEEYGDYGQEFIEIHHKVPLRDATEERKATIDDVLCVCSNCHSVLHHNGKEPLPVEELKQFIELKRRNEVNN